MAAESTHNLISIISINITFSPPGALSNSEVLLPVTLHFYSKVLEFPWVFNSFSPTVLIEYLFFLIATAYDIGSNGAAFTV